jgi:uncharacterized protein YidB (DUF937 family)
MDINQIMKLAGDPKVRQMVQGLFAQMGNKQGGGANVSALLNQLRSGGLNEQVKSWVGTGNNQPVSSAQLTEALGPDAVDQIAAHAGSTPEQTTQGLAKVLPELINSASPDGELADPQSLQDMMSEIVQPAPSGQAQGAPNGQGSKPTPNGQGSKAGQGSKPASAGQSSKPASAGQSSKPASAGQSPKPASAGQGARSAQSGPSSKSPRAGQGAKSPQASRSTNSPQANRGANSPQANQGANAPQASQGSNPAQAGQGSQSARPMPPKPPQSIKPAS